MDFTEKEYNALVEDIFRRFPSVQKSAFHDAYKPGLGQMDLFDEALGRPSRAFRAIHVAGTNGKGSVSARAGEQLLIPINMRDGSVLAVGRGSADWNYSAPHGAGRVMSRKRALNDLSMEEYARAMEGIYTTSVNEETLDEAPMAYKRLEDIIGVIGESVDVIEVLKPVYNFKASDGAPPWAEKTEE